MKRSVIRRSFNLVLLALLFEPTGALAGSARTPASELAFFPSGWEFEKPAFDLVVLQGSLDGQGRWIGKPGFELRIDGRLRADWSQDSHCRDEEYHKGETPLQHAMGIEEIIGILKYIKAPEGSDLRKSVTREGDLLHFPLFRQKATRADYETVRVRDYQLPLEIEQLLSRTVRKWELLERRGDFGTLAITFSGPEPSEETVDGVTYQVFEGIPFINDVAWAYRDAGRPGHAFMFDTADLLIRKDLVPSDLETHRSQVGRVRLDRDPYGPGKDLTYGLTYLKR